MTRTRVRRRAAIVVAGALALGLAGPGALSALGSDRSASPGVRHVVREGDTLWTLAVRFGEGRDPRVVVDRIETVNGLGGPQLRPGQVLRIPLDA